MAFDEGQFLHRSHSHKDRAHQGNGESRRENPCVGRYRRQLHGHRELRCLWSHQTNRDAMKKVCVNLCRLLRAITFILSGFVKAVDPLGTQYKINDYLEAMGMGGMLPDIITLGVSVLQSAVEFCLGIFLLFVIQRRLTSRLILLIMGVMTPLTLWLALKNP